MTEKEQANLKAIFAIADQIAEEETDRRITLKIQEGVERARRLVESRNEDSLEPF